MRLLEKLSAETSAEQTDLDEELRRIPPTADEYRRFLARTLGFVAPVELSISTTPGIEDYLDLRRFRKEELLRRDLRSLRMTAAHIEALPRCLVPLFDVPDEAFGWAYVLERCTLASTGVFQHFAAAIPGDVAFAASYLKCYFGSVGDMWRGFGDALDRITGEERTHRVIVATKTAFHFHRKWHAAPDDHESTTLAAKPSSPPPSGQSDEA